MDSALRIAVLGPGGVGGLLAALLAGDGHDVVCLAGRDTVLALREDGIRLSSALFGERTQPVEAAEVLDRPVDVCLVTVKATHLDEALQRAPSTILAGALVVPLLNGVEHVALLRERYPQATVVAGTMRVESTRTGPGQIRQDSPFASIELCTGPAVDRLARALRHAGFDVRVRDDEAATLWDKAGFLTPLALLTAVTGQPVGDVRVRWRDDLIGVIREVASVARAEGGSGDGAAVLATIDMLPAAMRPSMLRDVDNNRPLEVDAMGGAVVRAAARHGINVPVTARMIADLEKR